MQSFFLLCACIFLVFVPSVTHAEYKCIDGEPYEVNIKDGAISITQGEFPKNPEQKCKPGNRNCDVTVCHDKNEVCTRSIASCTVIQYSKSDVEKIEKVSKAYTDLDNAEYQKQKNLDSSSILSSFKDAEKKLQTSVAEAGPRLVPQGVAQLKENISDANTAYLRDNAAQIRPSGTAPSTQTNSGQPTTIMQMGGGGVFSGVYVDATDHLKRITPDYETTRDYWTCMLRESDNAKKEARAEEVLKKIKITNEDYANTVNQRLDARCESYREFHNRMNGLSRSAPDTKSCYTTYWGMGSEVCSYSTAVSGGSSCNSGWTTTSCKTEVAGSARYDLVKQQTDKTIEGIKRTNSELAQGPSFFGGCWTQSSCDSKIESNNQKIAEITSNSYQIQRNPGNVPEAAVQAALNQANGNSFWQKIVHNEVPVLSVTGTVARAFGYFPASESVKMALCSSCVFDAQVDAAVEVATILPQAGVAAFAGPAAIPAVVVAGVGRRAASDFFNLARSEVNAGAYEVPVSRPVFDYEAPAVARGEIPSGSAGVIAEIPVGSGGAPAARGIVRDAGVESSAIESNLLVGKNQNLYYRQGDVDYPVYQRQVNDAPSNPFIINNKGQEQSLLFASEAGVLRAEAVAPLTRGTVIGSAGELQPVKIQNLPASLPISVSSEWLQTAFGKVSEACGPACTVVGNTVRDSSARTLEAIGKFAGGAYEAPAITTARGNVQPFFGRVESVVNDIVPINAGTTRTGNSLFDLQQDAIRLVPTQDIKNVTVYRVETLDAGKVAALQDVQPSPGNLFLYRGVQESWHRPTLSQIEMETLVKRSDSYVFRTLQVGWVPDVVAHQAWKHDFDLMRREQASYFSDDVRVAIGKAREGGSKVGEIVRIEVPTAKASDYMVMRGRISSGEVNIAGTDFQVPREWFISEAPLTASTRLAPAVQTRTESIVTARSADALDVTAMSEKLDGVRTGPVYAPAGGRAEGTPVAKSIAEVEAVSTTRQENKIVLDEAARSRGGPSWIAPPPQYRRNVGPEVKLEKLLSNEGSSGPVLLGRLDGKEVVVKIFQEPVRVTDWPSRVAYFENELKNAARMAEIVSDTAPRFLGEVNVGGSPAFAMERIKGVDLNTLTPRQVRELLSPETAGKVERDMQKLYKAGLGGYDSPQIMILTERQTINGIRHNAGDAIFMDAGGLNQNTASWRPLKEWATNVELIRRKGELLLSTKPDVRISSVRLGEAEMANLRADVAAAAPPIATTPRPQVQRSFDPIVEKLQERISDLGTRNVFRQIGRLDEITAEVERSIGLRPGTIARFGESGITGMRNANEAQRYYLGFLQNVRLKGLAEQVESSLSSVPARAGGFLSDIRTGVGRIGDSVSNITRGVGIRISRSWDDLVSTFRTRPTESAVEGWTARGKTPEELGYGVQNIGPRGKAISSSSYRETREGPVKVLQEGYALVDAESGRSVAMITSKAQGKGVVNGDAVGGAILHGKDGSRIEAIWAADGVGSNLGSVESIASRILSTRIQAAMESLEGRITAASAEKDLNNALKVGFKDAAERLKQGGGGASTFSWGALVRDKDGGIVAAFVARKGDSPINHISLSGGKFEQVLPHESRHYSDLLRNESLSYYTEQGYTQAQAKLQAAFNARQMDYVIANFRPRDALTSATIPHPFATKKTITTNQLSIADAQRLQENLRVLKSTAPPAVTDRILDYYYVRNEVAGTFSAGSVNAPEIVSLSSFKAGDRLLISSDGIEAVTFFEFATAATRLGPTASNPQIVAQIHRELLETLKSGRNLKNDDIALVLLGGL